MGKRSVNIFSRQRKNPKENSAGTAENAAAAVAAENENNNHPNLADSGLNLKKTRLKMTNENSRSLKRMKKRGVMQQVMGKFPINSASG